MKREEGGHPIHPLELQMLTFLKFIGTERIDRSLNKIQQVLGISKSSVTAYCDNAIKMMLEIHSSYLLWPNWREKQEIHTIMEHFYNFPYYVAIVDGIHFPLDFCLAENMEGYYTRKDEYAVHSLIFVNHCGRILHAELR